jgi:hypothetical protein
MSTIYIVQAKPSSPDDKLAREEKGTKKDAIRSAVRLIARGREGVTITDETGRVFPPERFTEFYEETQARG